MEHIYKSCTNITSGFIRPSASEALSLQLNCINVNEALKKELVLSSQKKFQNKQQNNYRNLSTCKIKT